MVQNREDRRLDSGSVVWTVLDALAFGSGMRLWEMISCMTPLVS